MTNPLLAWQRKEDCSGWERWETAAGRRESSGNAAGGWGWGGIECYQRVWVIYISLANGHYAKAHTVEEDILHGEGKTDLLSLHIFAPQTLRIIADNVKGTFYVPSLFYHRNYCLFTELHHHIVSLHRDKACIYVFRKGSFSIVGGCSLIERKSFLHETAHNKVCGLSYVTGLWFKEIDIAFFFMYSWRFLNHKQSAMQIYNITVKAGFYRVDISSTRQLTP